MRKVPIRRKRRAAGRPRSSPLSRTVQLRLAKRAQRQRDAAAGQIEARLRLPRELAQRLLFLSRQPDFIAVLTQLLNTQAIEVARFPQLKFLCWNRRDQFLSAQEAWSLYERNWRFVAPALLEASEQQLIESLSSRFGGGIKYV